VCGEACLTGAQVGNPPEVWCCATAARDARGIIVMRRFAVTMGLVFQIGGLIICSVLGSFFVGMWLDRRLGSAPCLIIVSVMFGFVVAVIGAYRIVTRLSE